jgi:hypothetical protein
MWWQELDVEALLRPCLSFASCDKVWGFSGHGNVGLLYPMFQGVLVSHCISFEMLVTIYLTSFPSVFMRALVFSSCIMLFEDSTDYSRRCRSVFLLFSWKPEVLFQIFWCYSSIFKWNYNKYVLELLGMYMYGWVVQSGMGFKNVMICCNFCRGEILQNYWRRRRFRAAWI